MEQRKEERQSYDTPAEILEDSVELVDQIAADLGSKGTQGYVLRIKRQLPHPGTLTFNNSVEQRVNRDASGVTAHGPRSDQPRDINDCEGTENDGSGPPTRSKEEHRTDKD